MRRHDIHDDRRFEERFLPQDTERISCQPRRKYADSEDESRMIPREPFPYDAKKLLHNDRFTRFFRY